LVEILQDLSSKEKYKTMTYTKDFSVIVPVWRGAIKYLPKLFDSIPRRDGIEIIVVDNSKEPVSREEIKSDRDILFLQSAPERHAGGSRNEGIEAAHGKWLLFADADDFYTDDAFDVYYSMINTDAEIVYTGMGGIYEDTGEPSDRGDRYAKAVHDYLSGRLPETNLRLHFSSPCCKMVSHELVNRHHLRYDEVVASNDKYFSMLIGYYAKSITAVDRITYIATVNRGSLTRRRDYDVDLSRFKVVLRYNKFLRTHGLSKYQDSIMLRYKDICSHGFRAVCKASYLLCKFHQNPFIGYSRWFKSYKKKKRLDVQERQYITK